MIYVIIKSSTPLKFFSYRNVDGKLAHMVKIVHKYATGLQYCLYS